MENLNLAEENLEKNCLEGRISNVYIVENVEDIQGVVRDKEQC